MTNKIRKKQLKCPVCKKRLIDAEENTESELVPENEIKEGWTPDYYQKCPCCKNQIGIRKVS